MGNTPEDADARRARIAAWATEQQTRHGRYQPKDKAVRMIERELERLEPIFDRELHTSCQFNDPEIDSAYGLPYAPSPWHILPRALRAVRASQRDVLVDFGCGKGRIVHQAAKRPLKRVIGVEISPALAGFARTLVAAHRHEYRCKSVEIVACDAASFHVPDDLTIAYFYHPFLGKTLDTVLGNLIDSMKRHPRSLRLIYVGPVSGWQILATGRFRPVRGIWFNRAVIFESCE